MSMRICIFDHPSTVSMTCPPLTTWPRITPEPQVSARAHLQQTSTEGRREVEALQARMHARQQLGHQQQYHTTVALNASHHSARVHGAVPGQQQPAAPCSVAESLKANPRVNAAGMPPHRLQCLLRCSSQRKACHALDLGNVHAGILKSSQSQHKLDPCHHPPQVPLHQL